MTTHSYNVDISWEHDRVGKMCSPEVGNFTANNGCLTVATPPEFPKGVAGIWSPEHLFTAAVSSCLMTTFLAIAENSKLVFTDFKCKSEGKLQQVDGKFLMTEIVLFPEVTISNEEDREKALRVLQRSEAACLISNSIKSKVTMRPVVHTVVKNIL
ncbi:MAG TPA: OsmC family protein [Cyclobacteriaceae bacterium]|jgi:peroxiredoxin-like protein|nr:OsmC family protein [Cyclobacteriaceae bacterium]HMV10537.1 OsmC family protein [Cyclobacteriaceae bacterium]HMV89609.1 OsmC family protein [Cyclobacteriaceae bacterium]HMW99451.1 OsmC family protein [Cyclobacteriaceae bacterium]HMX48760.1 OsmC family protein [Cyclobacteriaceae bacterium]